MKGSFFSQLKRCSGNLLSWSKATFGNLSRKCHDLQKELADLNCLAWSNDVAKQKRDKERKLDHLLAFQEYY